MTVPKLVNEETEPEDCGASTIHSAVQLHADGRSACWSPVV